MGKDKKESVIKKLDGFIKPVVTRNDKGAVLSVGIVDGQKYYTYNKPESGLDQKPRTFEESYHVGIGDFRVYRNDIAKLIDNGQIYIIYIAPVVEPEVIIKEHENQISLF